MQGSGSIFQNVCPRAHSTTLRLKLAYHFLLPYCQQMIIKVFPE